MDKNTREKIDSLKSLIEFRNEVGSMRDIHVLLGLAKEHDAKFRSNTFGHYFGQYYNERMKPFTDVKNDYISTEYAYSVDACYVSFDARYVSRLLSSINDDQIAACWRRIFLLELSGYISVQNRLQFEVELESHFYVDCRRGIYQLAFK